ncbi:MAG: VCBS domain-containing protein, partial [Gammaproteobacteria bacterium]|nr:VCBS domain-containing protein [Gammaproteobacteria bacterium]
LATLAATLAACGGGGSGGPAAPPPAPEPEPENNPPTAAAATATATEDGDPASGDAVGSDEDGDDLTYSVSKQGELGTLALADDGKWTYTITDSPQIQALGAAATLTDTAEIQVSDGEDSATAEVTITIQGANDAPTAEDGAAEVTAGDAATAQGSLNAMDVDEGDTHTFAVTRQPDHGTLAVDEAGAWTYALDDGDPAVRALGHGETATDSGEVTATDSSGADNATAAAEVTVTITGIVDAPAVSAPAGVEENDATERPLAEVTSPDDGVTFAVDNPKFEVQTVGSTASLKLRAGESLDFESDADEDGSVTLMVTATDADGNTSAPTPVTVAVTNVNEAPSVVAQAMTVDAAKADEIDPDLTIPENSDGKAPGAVVALLALSDPDAGDTHTVTSSDERFEVIDAHGRKWLKLKEGQSLDHEGEPTIEVTLTATDDGDPAMSGTHKVTITVTDANDAPSITVQKATVPAAEAAQIDPDLTIREDSDGSLPGAVVAHIAVSDPDAGDTHTVTASGDRFEVIDAHGEKWLKLKEGAKLDHETEGTIEVTVTVTDQDGLSDSMPVTVTVTDADEAPSAPKPGSGTANINENFLGASITTVGGSVDPEGDDITYRVDNPDFEITGDGILKLRDGASLDFEEQPTVTVNLTAVDSKGNVSEPTPVTVTVGDLHENAPPSVAVAPDQTLAVAETEEAEAGDLLIELDVDDDDTGDTHTVTVDGDDRFEVVEADDGMWSLILKEGASLDHEAEPEGKITLTLTATDDGDPAASGTAEVVIEVTDANEAPTVTVT